MHTINLLIGDTSGDGHEKSDVVVISSNLSEAELRKAYLDSVELTGVDLVKDVCDEYEDRKIHAKTVKKLSRFGYVDSEWQEENWGVTDTDAWAELWMWFIKLSRPDFVARIVCDNSPNINIGGYGLYYL
jgi:hypothetical protein